jgi:hypothetical protein
MVQLTMNYVYKYVYKKKRATWGDRWLVEGSRFGGTGKKAVEERGITETWPPGELKVGEPSGVGQASRTPRLGSSPFL